MWQFIEAIINENMAPALARSRDAALNDAVEMLGGMRDMAKVLGRADRAEALADGARMVASLKEDPAAQSSARDAALEEAVDSARIARPPDDMRLSARDKVVFNVGVRRAVERLRALQSSPVSVLPVDKVREEARKMLGSRRLVGDPVGAVHAMLEALGVDPDAKTEQCRFCPHPRHGKIACMAPYEGRAGHDVACMCTESGEGITRWGRIMESEAERVPLGPPHREDADGCLADCPGCATDSDETCKHGRWWDSPCSECGRGDVVL